MYWQKWCSGLQSIRLRWTRLLQETTGQIFCYVIKWDLLKTTALVGFAEIVAGGRRNWHIVGFELQEVVCDCLARKILVWLVCFVYGCCRLSWGDWLDFFCVMLRHAILAGHWGGNGVVSVETVTGSNRVGCVLHYLFAWATDLQNFSFSGISCRGKATIFFFPRVGCRE